MVIVVMKSSGPVVFIIGPNGLQNGLLSRFLEQETGFTPRCFSSLNALLPDGDDGKEGVLLWDCLGQETSLLWKWVGGKRRDTLPLALFNATDLLVSSMDLVRPGVNGLFMETDPPEQIAKGLQAILRGDLWFSRKTMMASLVSGKSIATSSHAVNVEAETEADRLGLTPREQEVLLKIAAGFSNKQIGTQLNVSPYTVKVHVYNIFKKIGVTRRLQAALWAVKHLS